MNVKQNKKIFLFLLLFLVLLSACGKKGTTEETTAQQTEIVEETSTNTQTENNEEELTLNSGIIIKKGASIEVDAPTYYEGECHYYGEVTNMYPETGRVLLRRKLVVVEFDYRYVVDIAATSSKCGYDGPPEIKEINNVIRGVIYLDRNGVERIHYIRTLDDGSSAESGMKIEDTNEYNNLRFYGFSPSGESDAPQEIVDFYNNR